MYSLDLGQGEISREPEFEQKPQNFRARAQVENVPSMRACEPYVDRTMVELWLADKERIAF